MIKKIAQLICLITIFAVEAQTFDSFEGDRSAYEGGPVQFYKDLNTILMENHFERCGNDTSEKFLAYIEIKKGQGTILNKNPPDNCAAPLFIKAFDEINKLKKWKKVSGIQANTSIVFYPSDYFENFKENYTTERDSEFPGGMLGLKNQLTSILKKQNFKNTNEIKAILSFKISEKGVLNSLTIEPDNLDEEVKNKLIKSVEQLDKSWLPRLHRGVPIESSYRVPITL